MSDKSEQKKEKRWMRLESDPALMTKYAQSLGLPKSFQFHEVYGVDDELLQFVPRPVYAVVLLFAISKNTEALAKEQEAEIEKKLSNKDDKKEGNEKDKKKKEEFDGVHFMHQTIGNACGTIGICHSVMNLPDLPKFEKDSFFAKWTESTADMSPSERAKALEEDDSIEESHQDISSEGTSDPNSANHRSLHFIAFAEKGGNLYELDGRKKYPVSHGECDSKKVLEGAVAVIKEKFMKLDPKEVRWNICVLGKAN